MANASTHTRCAGRSLSAPLSQPIRKSPAGIVTISGSKSVGSGFTRAVFNRVSRQRTALRDMATALFDDLLNSADLAAFQADFDAVWMMRRFGEDVFDDAA